MRHNAKPPCSRPTSPQLLSRCLRAVFSCGRSNIQMEAGGWRRLQRGREIESAGRGRAEGEGRGLMGVWGGGVQLLLLDAGPLWQRIRPLQTSQAACNKQDARCHRSTCRPGGQTGVQSAQRPQVDVGGRLREFRKTSSGADLLQVQKGAAHSRRELDLQCLLLVAVLDLVPFSNWHQHFSVIYLLIYVLLLHWNDTDCL